MAASQSLYILGQMLRGDYFSEASGQALEQTHANERIGGIAEYINAHYQETLSLRLISENEHISYYHLSRLFKEVTRIIFYKYAQVIRPHSSAKALKNSKQSILSIALEYGFSTVKSYPAAFQEYYGVRRIPQAGTGLMCHDFVNSFSFWITTDLTEELKALVEPFHGGLGLKSAKGIHKASFWAFRMLRPWR